VEHKKHHSIHPDQSLKKRLFSFISALKSGGEATNPIKSRAFPGKLQNDFKTSEN
jgi:hypothetical protein